MILRVSTQRKLLFFVIVLAVMFMLTTAAAYAGQQVNYTALGNSLAFGVTPYHGVDKSYVDYIADRISDEGYDVQVNNFSFPGYKTNNVINDITALTDKGALIRAGISAADVITLDIGANDILATISINESTGEISFNYLEVAATIYAIGENVGKILLIIKELNPDVQVYLMGYYNPFPYLPENTQSLITSLMNNLNTNLETVASGMGAIFVPTADAIAKKAEKDVPNPEDIHLSSFGYKSVAKEFWKVMRVQFPTVK